VKRVTQGVFAIGPAGEWLDVRGAGTGASAGVIAIRYRPTGSPAGLPAEVAAVVPTTTSATYDARAFAAAPLTGAEIVEATKQLDAPVAATLLVERGQGFELDGKKLVALAYQGVPGRVIDAEEIQEARERRDQHADAGDDDARARRNRRGHALQAVDEEKRRREIAGIDDQLRMQIHARLTPSSYCWA
jgi:hypothetical protein